ncbi:glycosyl transferase [Amycolatopsis sp. H20-H5]|uniref:glycosyl transferase n=1 Tax=Amycolatopsis sp. H20-H5 TaxID=3046309 RepID=UPI002DBA8366|nr:glycosyl transferase [Amycolatopsis sp. H20-H5]MEC3981965.1 glycosyl transferase [Amycolatopsis sp. H20-H5]
MTDSHPGRPGRWALADSAIAAGFLVFTLLLFSGLWSDLGHGYLWNGGSDQNLWEWFFAVTAKSLLHLWNPLTSNLQDYPLGVNMMANTSMLGVSIPLTPVTLTFGPTVTWAVVLTGSLAGSATAWYWVFSRHLVRHRAAAAIGAGFCGFAPPMISHANAHPNFVAWFVLPFIALKVVKLAKGERPVRDGIHLGLLTAYQIFLGEEPLLIFALAFAVFAVCYLLQHRGDVRAMLRPLGIGLGVGAALAFVLVAFPLWWQFFGPQSYQALEHGPSGNDAAAMTRFATQSLAGDPTSAADVSINRTEENAFFGWPLIVLMVVVTIWLWREAVARSLAITMFLMAWLSLGATLVLAHHDTGVPGPWKLLADLPLFESVLESRFAMGAVLAVGALLALATDRVFAAPVPLPGAWPLPVRLLWIGAVVAVLLPVAPTELIVKERPPTPAFLADGTWRIYVGPGGTVVPVPLAGSGESEPLHWQVDAGLEYAMPEGYFVGPSGPGDKRGRYGAAQRPTSSLLDVVRQTGMAVTVTEAQHQQALDDLRYWRADVLIVVPREHDDTFRTTVDQLVRKPGQFVDGVWMWDVRTITP